MKQLHVSDLLSMSDMEKMYGSNDPVSVIFDDGESVECYFRQAALSSYFWKILADHNTDILAKHLLGQSQPNQLQRAEQIKFSQKGMSQLYKRIVTDIIDKTPDDQKRNTYEVLAIDIACAMNRIYNAVVEFIPEYVISSTAREMNELVNHPVIDKAYHSLQSSLGRHIDIERAYREATDVILNSPDVKHNNYARSFQIGALDAKQFHQLLIARGRITDIDQTQFRKPALSGYARGLHDIADSAMESRDASIAELQSKAPVSKSDYLNRRLQILTAVIQNVIDGDCKSTKYVPWFVTQADLVPLEGVHFVDEDGEEKVFKSSMKEYLNKTIYMRNPAYCNHLYKGGVCSTCLGDVAAQIPHQFSIGHIAVIGALGQFVQLSLSAKHLIVSKDTLTFVLGEEEAKFFKFPRQDDKETLYLNPTILNKADGVHFIFKVSDLIFFSDVKNNIRAEDVQTYVATFIRDITALVNVKGNIINQPLSIADPGRRSHMTREFIDYIINNQDLIEVSRSTVKISMERWNRQHPVFNIPQKVASVKEFMSQFESAILAGCAKHRFDANNPAGVADMIRHCYDIVKQCVPISIPHLSVMIAAIQVRDKEALDYRLPLPDGPREFATLANIYAYRSLSQTMAYENRLEYLSSPSLTLVKYRLNHPFDVLYFPRIHDAYSDVKLAKAKGFYPAELLDPILNKRR